jgi:hypothetical protein
MSMNLWFCFVLNWTKLRRQCSAATPHRVFCVVALSPTFSSSFLFLLPLKKHLCHLPSTTPNLTSASLWMSLQNQKEGKRNKRGRQTVNWLLGCLEPEAEWSLEIPFFRGPCIPWTPMKYASSNNDKYDTKVLKIEFLDKSKRLISSS